MSTIMEFDNDSKTLLSSHRHPGSIYRTPVDGGILFPG